MDTSWVHQGYRQRGQPGPTGYRKVAVSAPTGICGDDSDPCCGPAFQKPKPYWCSVRRGGQAGTKLQFVTEKFEDTAIGRFILAARAFIGEVELEKIAERTMRGKAERAKAGKIPRALVSAATGIPMVEKPVLGQLPLRKQQLSGRYSLTSCQVCPLFP